MLAIYSEHHVLALTSENIKNDIAGAGAKLDALGVEHFFSEVGGGNDYKITLAHTEEEDAAIFVSEVGQITLIKIIANLQPVTKNGDGEGTRGEAKIRAPEGVNYYGGEDKEEEGEEEGFEGRRGG